MSGIAAEANGGQDQQVFTLATGPSGTTARTLAALGQPILHHQDPAFLRLYARTVARLQQAFGGGLAPVILQGEAVLGLEAGVASLVGAEDIVLALVSGVFGKDLARLARLHAKEVIELEVSYREAVTPDQVVAALQARPDITVVSSAHCETVSGTVNPIAEIGPAVADAGAFLLVDAVASFAGMPVDPQAWRADLVVAGSEKCLGGPPGLSLVYASEAAWARMEANPTAPRASFLSILDWREAHQVDRPFPFAPSVSEIYALGSCLDQYLEEGPAAVHARHRRVARATRVGGTAMGLSLWAAHPSICSDTVTVFAVPDGLSGQQILKWTRSVMGVMLTGGVGDGAREVLRVGHMGPSAYSMAPVIALAALGSSLRAAGFRADIGAGVEAALAVLRE